MRRVLLLAASAGNEVMTDIASIVAHGLLAHGVAHEIVIDDLPSPSADIFLLVIAPHEFFPLFAEPHFGFEHVEKILGNIHVLNVEQPGSQWFELAWHYAQRSRGIFDISSEGCREFGRRGRVASHLPLGFASFLANPTPREGERPIDILFVGHLSPRREQFFARHAATFSRYRCRMVFTDVSSPRTTGTEGYYAGRQRLDLLAASKIVLNVHSSERPYFETHRALLALANRCLLVTETSRGTEPLLNGQHFVMDALDSIPSQCVRYLADPEVLAALASAGHDFVSTRWRASDTCQPLIDAVTNNSPATVSFAASTRDIGADETGRRNVMQRMSEARARRERGDDCRMVADNRAYLNTGPPSVSVVVTLYDYARYIEECLTSVLASEPVPGGHEIVVVDDGSTDDSGAIVESIMDRAATPIRLVRKTLNTGLAEARNTGVEVARGRAVFILDADNWIYPECLRVLFAALVSDGCAAVFPIIRTFSDQNAEPLGLISTRQWDVRSLVRGPYIDAMAMFDRDAVLSVGGYSTELIEHGWFGWEDYDLWLKLARAKKRCEIVPSVLASYRIHASSMIQRTNRSSENIAAHLRVKFRDLVSQYPELDRYFGFPAPGARPAPPASNAEGRWDGDEIYHRCEALQRRLTEVYASKSWRVTRPLRWVYGMLADLRMRSGQG
jgi:GT2 family glycosyltransferase